MIARGKNLPESKVCEANAVIGECALRTGSYALAEEAFRNMMKFRKDAFPVNQLATALKKQGKDKEATELFRQVADRFAMSERAEDRFETVRALLALSGSPESVERSRAFGMLETLLEDDPDHPEYRFQYAQLLAGNPRLFRERRIPGIEPNAAVLLLQLADAHPERPEYGLALVELMLKKLRYARNFREHNQRELADTVNLSERLLGRWPNDPQVISGMVRLHARYIGALRREGKNAWARRESDRLQGILEVLFYNPEISDAVKESLIRLQLQRLKLLRHDGRSYEGAELRKKSAGSWAFTTDRCSGCSGRSWRKPGRMMNPPSGKVKIPLFLNTPSKVCKLSAYRHSAICCARGKGKCPVPSGAVAEEGGYLLPLQAECQMRS